MPIKLKEILSKIILLTFISLSLHACTSKPYEISSPCVSNDSDNPWHRSPCQRRPANVMWDII